MKLLRLCIFFISLFVWISFAQTTDVAKRDSTQSAPLAATGMISVTTTPDSAQLFLDNTLIGVTPARRIKVPVGVHVLKISKEGYQLTEQEVIILSDSCKQFTISLAQAPKNEIKEATPLSTPTTLESTQSDAMPSVTNATDHKNAPIPTMFSQLIANIQKNSIRSVTILPFSTNSPDKKIGKIIAEYGVVFFSMDPSFRVIENRKYIREIQRYGYIPEDFKDNANALKVGKNVSSSFVVTGNVILEQDKLMISCKMINVENGEVASTAFAQVPNQEFKRFSQTTFCPIQLEPYRGIAHSLVIPGWGQSYYKKYVHSLVFFGLTAASVAGIVYARNEYKDKSEIANRYKTFDPSTTKNTATLQQWVNDANKSIQEKNNAGSLYTIFIVSASAVWALNLADAIVTEIQYSKRPQAIYFSYVPNLNDGKQSFLSMNYTFNF